MPFYQTSKPCTRWWWFATEIKEKDVEYQLDWAKANNFGGVEIAWVYPLYRYQLDYQRNHHHFYPKDTTAQKWLSPEWSAIVAYTKRYADSIGLACDFTFGSSWPIAGGNIPKEYGTQIYGDTSFRQWLTFAWCWPEKQLVINHCDSNAFNLFAKPVSDALIEPLKGHKPALFTDSWEIRMNSKLKVWTPGFEESFQSKFGYDILPFMEAQLDSFPNVRYDYMMHLDEYVTNGFYKPYVRTCHRLGAWSRVQCLASPTDVMTTYGLVDIPETEAMLNNPDYSRIVSSAACLSSRRMVSSETFTCMYGFKATYLKKENTADCKMVADALFAQGVNQHFYHGMPYNPEGSDTIEFFATTYFGPGGSLTPELPAFNSYMEKVSNILQRGKTYSDVAVYIPYEDAVMKGALPPEKQRVFVWGEYEMRYVEIHEELKKYHPLWINRHYLEEAEFRNGKLSVGDAAFSSLYVDVKYLDVRALKRILELAKSGLKICLKSSPIQPGKNKDENYGNWLNELKSLPNVSSDLGEVILHPPLIEGDSIPPYWCRVESDSTHYIFLAQRLSANLEYPIYSGQSLMKKSDFYTLTFRVNGKTVTRKIEFKPYQSVMIKIDSKGELSFIDISFVPKDPVVLPREMQKSFF